MPAAAHSVAMAAVTCNASSACCAALAVAKHSGCPAGRWQDEIAPLLAAARQETAANLTYLNVGANKGYNVAELLQRYHKRGAGPRNSEAWHRELLKGNPKGMRVKYGCGLCNPCKHPPPSVRYHVPVEVHAIEMVDVNAAALRRLFGAFGVPGTVWHLATSNYSGSANYRAAPYVGLEHYELGKGTNRQVACSTLDAFAASRLRQGQTIDLLSIDVEGQDALVLEGARGLLSSRRVSVLEFEFIARGFWRKDHPEQRRLAPVLESLEAFGYRCFWQGEEHAASGRLAPASGPHWCDAFQFKGRANLVCSHLPSVLRIFDRLSIMSKPIRLLQTALEAGCRRGLACARSGRKSVGSLVQIPT